MSKRKKQPKLTDFLPKEDIDDFIEYQSDPESKKIWDDGMQEIQGRLDDLEENLERKMTKAERNAVIDIVEKYSPKDENGDYLSFETLLPFEHAWLIYQTELQRKKESLIKHLQK